jgi:hypothetical protein
LSSGQLLVILAVAAVTLVAVAVLRREAVDAAETAVDMRRDLIAFQRDTLAGLRQQGRVGTTTLRAIEHDLDLEEARLPGI